MTGPLRAAALALTFALGVAGAHIVPLDVTVSRAGAGIDARVRNPDGTDLSGVRLAYRLGRDTAPVRFDEVRPGTYRSAGPVQVRAAGPVTLIDRTFPGEEAEVRVTTAWPPPTPTSARIPARPLRGVPVQLGPEMLVPVGVAVVGAVGLGIAVRRSGRRGGTP
ncbi:hypothetical protein [Deinococcus aquiradiocola]|uniref:DUF1775 domain-containing protein n=1 Tax=Deinococcus aquiradiocola TaxID=393059 RepID=A0A917P8U0_9DEIO|nr:hypothetical protein [Deinococcus aquiradiocola]GGJ66698.1 hypothetical protein GCM10008939_08530 [Deinococcus aquiradiocola]